jgi:peptide deformylase
VFVARVREDLLPQVEALKPTAFFNPTLTFPKKPSMLKSEIQHPIVMWESCLSVPGMVYVLHRSASALLVMREQ